MTFFKSITGCILPSPAVGTAQIAIAAILLSDHFRDAYFTVAAMAAVAVTAAILDAIWPSED
jgi:hypothetical protein